MTQEQIAPEAEIGRETDEAHLLDWLEANMPLTILRYQGMVEVDGGPPQQTLRQAIRAAMAEQVDNDTASNKP